MNILLLTTLTWPEAAVSIAGIIGGILFFGIMITEKWPWEKK